MPVVCAFWTQLYLHNDAKYIIGNIIFDAVSTADEL